MIRQDDPRRWKERADGSMIYEDHLAHANLHPEMINNIIRHNDAPLDNSRMQTTPLEIPFFEGVYGKRR